MSFSELDIQKKLVQGDSPNQIFSDVIQEHYNSSTLDHFLFHSGQYKELIQLNIKKIKKNKEIHWAPFLQLLGETQSLESNELLNLIKKSIKDQKAEKEALFSPYFQKIEPTGRLRDKWLNKLKNQFEKAKNFLYEKVLFFRDQKLIQEEKRVLEELKLIHNDDPEFQTLYKDFSLRWAREVIQSSSAHKLDIQEHKSHLDPFSNEEKVILDQINISVLEILSTKPQFVDDFSLMFIFLGDFEKSLNILERFSLTESRDWLKIEILLNLNRFLEALLALDSIEPNYADNPETAFAAAYVRAQAYWGLKQPSLALETLENLISIRPNYRSAQSFLIKWKQGQNL